MSSPNTLTKPAVIRRTRFAFQTIALVFAVTACCAFAGILAERFPRRFDATSTREHHLSPRTEALLTSLTGEYEVVVTANFSTLDPAAARRTQDVLDNFSRASSHVRTTIIDVSSPRGLTDLDALVGRLVARFKPALDKQRDGLERASQAVAGHVAALGALSTRLSALKDSVKDSDPSGPGLQRLFADLSARCRVAAEDLSKAQLAARDAATHSAGGPRSPAPATDEAVAALRVPVSAALELVGKAGDTLEQITRSTDDKLLSLEVRSQARAPAAEANALRTLIGQSLGLLDDLPRTPIGSVLRVLERSSAAIVIAPPSTDHRTTVTSVELSAIFPPRSPGAQDGIQLDLRARTEELLAGAITTLARDDAPIVVFVHGRDIRIAPDFRPVLPIVERLRLRGIDAAEWPAALDAEPPVLKSLDPPGKRPVVYIVLSMGANTSDDALRLGKLVAACTKLIDAGKRVLFCEVPSTMQSLGQKDPMAEVLGPLGIRLDSGRPLLHQTTGPRGRVVTADTIVTDPHTDHPIAKAIRGLATYLPWAVPVAIADKAQGVQPVVVIDSSSRDVWAESEWLGFSQIPSEQQAMLANPPSPDPTHDDIFGSWPTAAPKGWPIVVAAERSAPAGTGGKQRVVVIGSNKWISAEVIGAEAEVGGQRVPAYPGNMELLDASIHWLAGQESLISASATAREVPRIPALSDGMLSTLRWGLIGGLPLLILLLGAVWRLARG
ncbi:MAG TPA: hypothetical protein PKE29_00150 [Phycisphaerales bacterium]|nr:hypothetical protein [Phycisphaerales bacterium]